MEQKYGFLKMTADAFSSWIQEQRVARTVLYLQQHHTFKPDYQNFTGSNHFEMQRGMKNYHVVDNGWRDIGQHFSIFPDGAVLTGRSLEHSPACIFRNNAHAICIENVGYFDAGHDVMTQEQKDAIVAVSAAICRKFSIPLTTERIVYHHWFHMSSGERNNGSGGNKTCPGTRFFGGNKVRDCETHFLPLIRSSLTGREIDSTEPAGLKKYVAVTANRLNIRSGPSTQYGRVSGREQAELGAVLRVYEEQNRWYRISQTRQHWVYGHFTTDVERKKVSASRLNIRNRPSMSGAVIGSYPSGQEVFVYKTNRNWSKVALDESWVSSDFLRNPGDGE